jgi:predicted AAA+ superfamily ATPase
MERKVINELLSWKNNPKRQPLLLQGARQVGKTYILLTFGKQHYKNTAYFSMEESKEISAVFERDLRPDRIIRELEAINGQSILPESTLIIFDEIQACEKALSSLKYFAENAPQYHVAAAGSLLGVAVNREKFSFPVGKVDMLYLYPMDFEEFLWAVDKKNLCSLISDAYENFTPLSLHDTALDLYRTYLAVGGMPRVVQEYADKQDYNFVSVLQRALNDSYIADMAKYASPQETARIMAVWASIPAQLAKENRKFQYKCVKSKARANEYGSSLDWLKSAGIINKCVLTAAGKMPLAAYAKNESFKVYIVDTGLLCSKTGITLNMSVNTPNNIDTFKGALTENYIMQALVTNGITPYYWCSQGTAEIDFLFQNKQGDIIPIEVKSSDNVRSKSLRIYCETYNPPYSIRISAKNFGYENNIKSIPLYAAGQLKD